MISMVVDREYRCLVMSDIPPTHKKDGHSADDYTGCDTLDHVSEGKQAWKAAWPRKEGVLCMAWPSSEPIL